MNAVTLRRTLLLGAGAAGLAAAAGAGMLLPRNSHISAPVGPIDPTKITALGDGFFLVDGWVLIARDIENLDAAKPVSSKS